MKLPWSGGHLYVVLITEISACKDLYNKG